MSDLVNGIGTQRPSLTHGHFVLFLKQLHTFPELPNIGITGGHGVKAVAEISVQTQPVGEERILNVASYPAVLAGYKAIWNVYTPEIKIRRSAVLFIRDSKLICHYGLISCVSFHRSLLRLPAGYPAQTIIQLVLHGLIPRLHCPSFFICRV